MESTVIINLMISLAFIVFIALPAILNRQKLNNAIHSIDSADKTDEIKAQIIKGMRAGAGKGFRAFYGFSILVVFGCYIVASLVSWLIEPEITASSVLGWSLLFFMFYGAAFIVLLICTGYAFIVRYSVQGVSKTVVELQKLHPESEYIMRVNGAINTGVAQDIVRVVTVVGVIGASLSGAVLIAALFMASSAAIDCARSSKCL